MIGTDFSDFPEADFPRVILLEILCCLRLLPATPPACLCVTGRQAPFESYRVQELDTKILLGFPFMIFSLSISKVQNGVTSSQSAACVLIG